MLIFSVALRYNNCNALFIEIGEKMYYQLDQVLHKLPEHTKPSDARPLIALYTYQEWQLQHQKTNAMMLLPKSCESASFCRLECYPTYLFGTLAIPVKHDCTKKKKLFFYIESNKLTIVEDTGFVMKILDEFTKIKHWETNDIELVLADFLEELIRNDLLYVEELENRISKLEVAVLNGNVPHFNHQMMLFRKELLTYHYYYSQLIDLAEVLIANENNYFHKEHLKFFESFIRRLDRLQNIILMLRDSASQIREEYQSQIDIKQNNTMRLLTVVTSVFLPLTLIVGWYGMNFRFMPELGWQYGYPYVILLSIITIITCLWLFKRMHFF